MDVPSAGAISARRHLNGIAASGGKVEPARDRRACVCGGSIRDSIERCERGSTKEQERHPNDRETRASRPITERTGIIETPLCRPRETNSLRR
jgi:hypothetical protein